MIGRTVAALLVGVVASRAVPTAAPAASHTAAAPPQLLSETGLFVRGTSAIDPENRSFSPQYPLWSDGARKSRWVRLPRGARIDVRDIDRWDFPVGTRFWKEFEFGGRKVETRWLRKDSDDGWTFASYVWNDEQTDAVLAPAEGLPNVATIAPGRAHSIPSVTDCRACHDSARTEILGFTALQLSTDRDPLALHAEPPTPDAVTLQTLVERDVLQPARPDLVTSPPRIQASDARTRTVRGYLSTNCGSCHNTESSIANLGLSLKASVAVPAPGDAAVQALLRPTAKWQIPHVPPGASQVVSAGAPDLSALFVRMRSRRPSSQMPPLGTVLPDRQAIELVSAWIDSLSQ